MATNLSLNMSSVMRKKKMNCLSLLETDETIRFNNLSNKVIIIQGKFHVTR
jgi:hypothetical protein